MKIYYIDDEIEIFRSVDFQVFDLDGIVSPILNAVMLEQEGKQVCIMMDKVKKIEFIDAEE